ncbi:MAG: hypothetical protein JWN72_1928, partial [Thermoleophilia bacterium]|nr:hypothetical protein [Thermoleophilia bacterium]
YSEYHTYTYYYGPGPGPARYLDGAVEGDVEYKVTPMPDNRVLRISGSTIDVPGQRCFIANQREQCNLLPNYGKLQPGLNSGLIIPPKYVAGSAKNTNRIDFPGWLKGGALWVYANGTIDTPAGTIAKNTQVHIRGLGECYWTSPKFAGKQEGPCNSCEALWTLPDGTVGGCSILTRDDVVRKVYEVYTGFDMETGAVTLVAKPDLIATDAYTINFTPAWRCSTKVPSLRAKTCARLQTGGGGPVSNPGGSYVSPRSGGTAIVDSAPISEGGA